MNNSVASLGNPAKRSEPMGPHIAAASGEPISPPATEAALSTSAGPRWIEDA
jgi:hypothetical protein